MASQRGRSGGLPGCRNIIGKVESSGAEKSINNSELYLFNPSKSLKITTLLQASLLYI